MATTAPTDARVQLKRRYTDFLERQDGQWDLGDAVSKLYSSGDDGKPAQLLSRRLVIPEHHIREFDRELLGQLLNNPSEHLPAFEDALKESLRSGRYDAGLLKLLGDHTDIHIGLKGDFGRHEVSPRELTSALLGKLVAVYGIVTKCSVVRPKVRGEVFFKWCWVSCRGFEWVPFILLLSTDALRSPCCIMPLLCCSPSSLYSVLSLITFAHATGGKKCALLRSHQGLHHHGVP